MYPGGQQTKTNYTANIKNCEHHMLVRANPFAVPLTAVSTISCPRLDLWRSHVVSSYRALWVGVNVRCPNVPVFGVVWPNISVLHQIIVFLDPPTWMWQRIHKRSSVHDLSEEPIGFIYSSPKPLCVCVLNHKLQLYTRIYRKVPKDKHRTSCEENVALCMHRIGQIEI